MTRPVKHYGKWRIRWTDHVGERQSAVFESHEDARRALLLAESEVLRSSAPKLAAHHSVLTSRNPMSG